MKKTILKALRFFGLLKAIDKTRYYLLYITAYKENKAFSGSNPSLKFPPPYYMYETYGLDYYGYYVKGGETAKWLISLIAKYKPLRDLNILDWGCGPARIIRHFPSLTDFSCTYYGTDYNEDYISWCSDHIPGIRFSSNKIVPPLSFEDGFFDVIYGISIFTHLSEENHYKWFNELMRVLKTGGILILTLAGKAMRSRLFENEIKRFSDGELVVRSNTKEGHRTYVAFQPESFIRKLVGEHEVLEFIEGEIIDGLARQDKWIIRKK